VSTRAQRHDPYEQNKDLAPMMIEIGFSSGNIKVQANGLNIGTATQAEHSVITQNASG